MKAMLVKNDQPRMLQSLIVDVFVIGIVALMVDRQVKRLALISASKADASYTA